MTNRGPSFGRSLSLLIPIPCVTCGQPVVWMQQHKECWKFEEEERKKEQPKAMAASA